MVSGPLSVVNCEVDAVAEQSAPNEPTDGPLSVVSCPLPVASCTADAVDESATANEPTVARENVTNEPTVVRENVTNEPTVARENVTNEPTVARENATNEPTVARENVTNEPTVARENATNEPTVARENVTNEPTSGPLSVVSCPLPVASCTAHAVDESETYERTHRRRENVTNEPTVARENVTNEPTSGPLSVVSCPLPVASCDVEAVDERRTNEPTDAGKPRERTHRGSRKRDERTHHWSVVSGQLSVASCSCELRGRRASARTNPPTPRKRDERTHRGSRKRDERTHRGPLSVTYELTVVASSCAGTEVSDAGRDFEEGFSVQESESIRKACEKIRLARDGAVAEIERGSPQGSGSGHGHPPFSPPRAEEQERQTRRSTQGASNATRADQPKGNGRPEPDGAGAIRENGTRAIGGELTRLLTELGCRRSFCERRPWYGLRKQSMLDDGTRFAIWNVPNRSWSISRTVNCA